MSALSVSPVINKMLRGLDFSIVDTEVFSEDDETTYERNYSFQAGDNEVKVFVGTYGTTGASAVSIKRFGNHHFIENFHVAYVKSDAQIAAVEKKVKAFIAKASK